MINLIKVVAEELGNVFRNMSQEDGFTQTYIEDVKKEWKPRNPNWRSEAARYMAYSKRQNKNY